MCDISKELSEHCSSWNNSNVLKCSELIVVLGKEPTYLRTGGLSDVCGLSHVTFHPKTNSNTDKFFFARICICRIFFFCIV